jgi:hypothetical protein
MRSSIVRKINKYVVGSIMIDDQSTKLRNEIMRNIKMYQMREKNLPDFIRKKREDILAKVINTHNFNREKNLKKMPQNPFSIPLYKILPSLIFMLLAEVRPSWSITLHKPCTLKDQVRNSFTTNRPLVVQPFSIIKTPPNRRSEVQVATISRKILMALSVQSPKTV